ncbi:MAG: hypothetical protein JF628_05580 [Sphingomonas sp.]|nr:hypothetical protein [Sphingomonas sp.]
MSDASLGDGGLTPAGPALTRRATPRRITTKFPAMILIAGTPGVSASAASGAPLNHPGGKRGQPLPVADGAGCVASTVTQAVNSP